MQASSFKDASQKPASLPALKWYAAGSTRAVDFSGTPSEANEVVEFVNFQLKPEVRVASAMRSTSHKDLSLSLTACSL